MKKFVTKVIGKRVVRVSEFTWNAFIHDARTAQNYITFKKAYKAAKNSADLKMAQYIPGGVKDPVRLAKEAADYEAYKAKELIKSIQSKYPKDEFSQFKAKKSAEKISGIFGNVKDILMGPQKKAMPLTKSQLLKKAKEPLSRRDFWDILNDRPNMQKGSFLGDAAEIAEQQRHGGIGRSGFLNRLNMRRRSAKRVYAEARAGFPKASKADRVVNARAKGVRFIYIKGRGIVPIRPKK